MVFATAELAPLVKVGGLGEAACGLVRALRAAGHHVDVVVPDYGPSPLEWDGTAPEPVDVPAWVGGASVRRFELDGIGAVHAVAVPGMARPHPYVEPGTGAGWADNDRRFFGFSAAVTALAHRWQPDVVHLNDWHTATALASLDPVLPTVFTIHNLAYQGWADAGWGLALGPRAGAFHHEGACNPMAGAIRLADRVVAVSPAYAAEIRRPELGEGLHDLLAARRDELVGILNGIDTGRWDPSADVALPATYTAADLAGRAACAAELRRRAGFEGVDGPVIGLVARMVAQKGVDVAVALTPLLPTMGARMVLVGDGDPAVSALARDAAAAQPDRVWFSPFGEDLARLVCAGSDVMLVPSRFEPCGLTQMEAMAYGAVPVVSGVGGLRDTVIDADLVPARGTGFVAATSDAMHIVDAVHRALRATRDRRRWGRIQRRGMTADWSWARPAAAHAQLYADISGAAAVPAAAFGVTAARPAHPAPSEERVAAARAVLAEARAQRRRSRATDTRTPVAA